MHYLNSIVDQLLRIYKIFKLTIIIQLSGTVNNSNQYTTSQSTANHHTQSNETITTFTLPQIIVFR